MQYSNSNFMALLGLFAGVLLLRSDARADILELNDGNLIECKLVRKERSSRGEVVVVRDEEGVEKSYLAPRIKSFIRTQRTSWEVRAERQEWYARRASKVKDTWQDHTRFARRCYDKHLREEATEHFQRAYALRKSLLSSEEDQVLKLAQWLEDCELFDEAMAERRSVYEARKTALGTTPRRHESLANWCKKFELLPEAVEQYEAALRIQPENKRLQASLDQVRRQLAIPMDNGFYRAARIRVAAAARWIRTQQSRNGAIGSDILEAGVHGQRGMTSLATMALLADWDFGILAGKYEAGEVPPEVVRALDYLEGFEPSTNPRLRGDDVWGQIFALDLFVQCYKRAQFADRKDRLSKEINALIKALSTTQRPDGGWFYYNFVDTSASFVTASAVLSLVSAANEGFEVDRTVIEQGAEQIKSMRQGHGTFTYSSGLAQGPVGACARSPVCELALTVTGAGNESSLRYAIDIFFKNRHILERLKGSRGTHIGAGKTAPYYLLFAHYWTARAIKHLDRKYQRIYLNGLGGGLVAYQEDDATFGDWTGTRDYKVYGTAFAALTLYSIASLKDEVAPLGDPPGATEVKPEGNPGGEPQKSPPKKTGDKPGF